jgi:dTDP-4-amino-4,6-dideoxygalactose transaminase
MYKIKRVLPYLRKEWVRDLERYLDTYDFFQEGIVEEVEDKVKEYTGREYALCVNSGSNALFMCLCVVGKPGQQVIMPNYGYPATFKACKMLGLTPVSVDIKENTLSMNPTEIRKAVNSSTAAIVHIGNNGVIGGDIEEIKSIAEHSECLFLEDSAPSMLQKFRGINAGCFGDVAVFSFSATKPLTCGEGAVIVTDNKELYEQLKLLRHTPKYSNKDASLNFLLSPFLAAYLLPQFNHVEEIIQKRERIHNTYKKYLNIFEEHDVTNRYGAIMYLSGKAESISKRFTECGIQYRHRHYTLYEEHGFPVSEKVISEIIDLPSHYSLNEKQIKYICGIVRSVENYE